MRKHKKKIVAVLVVLIVLVLLVVLLLAILLCLTCGNKRYVPTIQSVRPKPKISERTHGTSLKVITLNLAHGRKDGWHQLLLPRETIVANLSDIAAFLKKSQPDIVALQEADGVCFWSGKFDHVSFLAEKIGCRFFARANSVQGLGLNYGTALLSQMPLAEPIAFTFDLSWPTPAKGFLLSVVEIAPGKQIDVVSLHLDFLSQRARSVQVKALVAELRHRNRPLIVMGDFNCDWREQSSLPFLAKQLQLSAYQDLRTDLTTFPTLKKRIDWILISRHFRFLSYHTVQDQVLSDHQPVVAILEFK